MRALLKGPLNPHFQFHILPDNPLPCILDSYTTDSITFPLVLHRESQKRDSQLPTRPDPMSPKPKGKNPLGSDRPHAPVLDVVKQVSPPKEPQTNKTLPRLPETLISIQSSPLHGMEDTSKSVKAKVYMEQSNEKEQNRQLQVGRKKRTML